MQCKPVSSQESRFFYFLRLTAMKNLSYPPSQLDKLRHNVSG